MSSRDRYIAQMKFQLDELDSTLNQLEVKADLVTNQMQEKYRTEMNQLREQSSLALEKLDALKTDGEDSWNTIVSETEKTCDALLKSFKNFKSGL